MGRLNEWIKVRSKIDYLKKMEDFTAKKHSTAAIILIFDFINVITAIIFYPLIPYVLNYAPDIIEGKTTWSNFSYPQQFSAFILIIMLTGSVFLFLALKDIGDLEELVRYKNEENEHKLRRIRKKCLNMPYIIYCVQIFLPIIVLLFLSLLIGVLKRGPVIILFKLGIMLFSFFTLVGVVSFIFSKRIFTRILLFTFEMDSMEGLRLGIRSKIFLQVLPILTTAILFTSLIGYSRVVSEKGDVLFSIFKMQLVNKFKDIGAVKDADQLENSLAGVMKNDFSDVKKSYFYMTPEGQLKTLDSSSLSKIFIRYMEDLSPAHNGRIYDFSGETQGVVIKLDGTRGMWTVGVKYEVLSQKAIIFFIISFLVLITVNIIVLSYFSKALSDDIRLVAYGLNKIVEGNHADLNKKLPVTSNDEIGDLVLAFNRIQDLEKAHIKSIQEQQARLIEKERLASLGQLIGGITHNLRSPIMSIAGAVEALRDLTSEYEQSIDDSEVTKEDHHEIAKEMRTWVEKIKPHCSYMSEIISTVKGQAVNTDSSCSKSFTLGELVKKVDILMNHELKTFHCRLEKDIRADLNTGIKGEINNLVQILDNLIVNAIHSYDGKEGVINFSIIKKENNVEFIIRDSGKGIQREVQDKLFKEMITTKGKNGTGLGLYMSYSTVKGHFGGDMRFKSEEGKGTAFYITISCITSEPDREG